MASLIRNGVDVNMSSAYFGAPLKAAAERGRVDVSRFLLEHGADPNTVDGYGGTRDYDGLRDDISDTALNASCRRGSDTIVGLLLDPKYGPPTPHAVDLE